MNAYQARTSPTKLRGGYYTPIDLARLVVRRLRPGPDDLVVDPACGDGSFLEAAAAEGATRILGFDVDPEAVEQARARLAGAGVARHADVLAEPDIERLLGDQPRRGRLLVVGNPPYVEAKRLARDVKQRLAKRHPDALDGAPDLYLYFLHVCLGWLRGDDRLAFVLPNKVLVNANAQRVRERLLGEGTLRGLWLATRAGLFPGAAVYPIVLLAGPGCDEVETVRLARDDDGALQTGPAVHVAAATFTSTTSRALYAPPAEPVLARALLRLASRGDALTGVPPPRPHGRDSSEQRLDHLLDIRWTVSFHRAGLREKYVTPRRPEGPHARPFLGGGPFAGNGEVARHRLRWAGWWIRYDEEELSKIGNAVPGPEAFGAGKVVICQNGRTLRAAWDADGYVLKDTFLAGLVREADHPLTRHPRAIVGLLATRAVHFFYSHVFHGGHVGGGYLHFLRSFLIDVPIGTWTEAQARDVEGLVGTLERGPDVAAEERIEEITSKALGLGESEIAAIAAWAAADANWTARDRIRQMSPLP